MANFGMMRLGVSAARPWRVTRGLLLASVLVLSACDLSPEYKLPELFGSSLFKEEAAPAADADAPQVKEDAPEVKPAGDISWKRVDEKAKIEEFAWWRMFGDPALDALEEQAMKDNPSLEVAAQRVRSARGLAGVSEANLYPTIDATAGPMRQKPAAANINGSFPQPVPIRTKPYTTYTAQGTVMYELDLFGMNRNTARAANHDADAEANNYRAARLALQTDVAQAYFQYAALKAESDLLERTLKDRRAALKLTRQKRDVGTIDDLVLSSSETDLANVEADRAAVAQQLATVEHMLAALLGVTPAELKLGDVKLAATPPQIPAGLPSTLLERRPDIQAAAEKIAAANARIGAARAGYFPNISLSGVFGYSSTEMGDLFKKGNDFWSIPAANAMLLTQPIFQGGRITSTLDARKADYEGAVASYRGAALQAFREVEDTLSNLRTLREQAAARNVAYGAAKRAYTVAKQRYDVGYSSHLDFLDAERSYLAAERSNVQVTGQRFVATVQLVKALGGSWETAPAHATATTPETVKTESVPAPR